MKSRFEAIALRRAALVDEIELERDRMAGLLQVVSKQIAMVSVGFALSQLLGRSRWIRWAALAGTALSAVVPVLARILGSRR